MPAVTLAAAAIAGVDEVYRIGGAQAIAAMAYGTESIRPVDVIVGPGNVYVAVAKREVAGEGLVGVPSAFAGPSEVVVVADASVAADLAAIDVIVQAEHGPGGLAWLVTWDEAVADAVVDRDRPRRWRRRPGGPTSSRPSPRAATPSWSTGPSRRCAVANLIAPEHLELLCRRPGVAGAARAPRRRGVLRAVGAGLGRRLHRRPEPRAAHRRHRPASAPR